jgi:hypothetical protein
MIRAQSLHPSRILGLAVILWLAATMMACGGQEIVQGQGAQLMPSKSLEEVLQEHTSSLMAIAGVVGTAQGLCNWEPCIRVFVVESSAELLSRIPPEIEGYPVEVQETGEFRKLDPG